MKDKVWEVEYEGHSIRVTNKLRLIPPKTSEVLEIDGIIIEHHKGSFLRLSDSLIMFFAFDGIQKLIEVRFAQLVGGLGTGCQIFVDGEFIGGDDSIQYIDPTIAIGHLEKGFMHYFLTSGLIRFGLPFATIMTIVQHWGQGAGMIVAFIFYALFFGGGMSLFSWKGMKAQAIKREQIGQAMDIDD